MLPEFVKKCIVALVAVLTFGTFVPTFPTHYVNHHDDKEPLVGEKKQQQRPVEADAVSSAWDNRLPENVSQQQAIDTFSQYALAETKRQGLYKFGDRVGERIGKQYVHQIAPAFISAVRRVGNGHDAAWIRRLDVTRAPAGGYGERILHVYQKDEQRELVKLHVRREHPPKEGYWFDFHYHTALDGFRQHHEVKRIYWGKNMPPKWRA